MQTNSQTQMLPSLHTLYNLFIDWINYIHYNAWIGKMLTSFLIWVIQGTKILFWDLPIITIKIVNFLNKNNEKWFIKVKTRLTNNEYDFKSLRELTSISSSLFSNKPLRPKYLLDKSILLVSNCSAKNFPGIHIKSPNRGTVRN